MVSANLFLFDSRHVGMVATLACSFNADQHIDEDDK
jgi:hypothetical protein